MYSAVVLFPSFRYELPLLAEDALTFLEPSGQKKLMEVLDETLDVIRSVANESGVIERTTAKDEVPSDGKVSVVDDAFTD